MSPNDTTPRNLHKDTTIPPIWLSGVLDSMKWIEIKVDKTTAEVEKIKNEASKQIEDEDTPMVKDHEKDSLMDADDKKEEES
jgi:hypothetical protein